MNKTIHDLFKDIGRPTFARYADAMIAGESGFFQMKAPYHDAQAWFFYTPIPETGWSMAIAIPEDARMKPVYDYLRSSVAMLVLGMAVLLLTINVVSLRFTTPIRNIALALRRLSTGDMDTRITGTHCGDEVGELATGFNTMVKELNLHIDTLAKETAAREAVESEIRVARQIQESFIPRTFPPFPQHHEFQLHAILKPAKECAGDFYDFFVVDDEHLMLVLADVSGKSVPAALFMVASRTLLHAFGEQVPSPAAILKQANDILVKGNDNMMFVTLFIGRYSFRTGKLVYANAGHPSPYLCIAQGDVHPLGTSTGTCLGLIEGSTWEEVEHKLEVHDTLLLYTDGVTEAGVTTEAMFDEAGLIAALDAAPSTHPEPLCRYILDTVRGFEGDRRTDDITLLALERTA
jgi:phosphoserine phosphatase RsbU/P